MEKAEAIVRRLYESGFAADVINEVVAEVLRYHLPSGALGGRAELLAGAEAYRRAFPDVKFSIEELRVEGEAVEVRWRMRGTHSGDFAGYAPTGRVIEMRGRHVERVVGDEIVERWGESDHASLAEQLAPG